ncbi:MAG: SpoIVB peptidase [Oscillospiraceae bacterium]|nr:SpoIVB peptidase [Oscillospiraceae bacterium]
MEQKTEKPQRWAALLTAAAIFLLGVVLVWPVNVPQGEDSTLTAGSAVIETARTDTGALMAGKIGPLVIPVGRTVGIKLFSDGVLVVGLSDIQTKQSTVSPARDMGLKVGDVITHVNDCEVDTIEQMQSAIQTLEGEQMTLKVMRQNKPLQLCGAAVCSAQGTYQLGTWIRDSMAGIGTVTFYDPKSQVFGALGHGVNDVDTAQLMTMQSGSVMHSSVADVKKGMIGTPGELHGSFDLQRDMGQLYANTHAGIFGTMGDESILGDIKPMEIARRSQIKTGPATILSNVAGEEVKEYQVEIMHLYPAAEGEMRNLMLKVTDPELLEQTGGIVQGMSGSPILQNGRLVGAVTHVLVNDPTRGYGILMENMLDAAG